MDEIETTRQCVLESQQKWQPGRINLPYLPIPKLNLTFQSHLGIIAQVLNHSLSEI
jgi:hypothetical protein